MSQEKPQKKTLAEIPTEALKLRGFEIYNSIEKSVAIIDQHKASIEQGYKEIGVINQELTRRAAAEIREREQSGTPKKPDMPESPVSQETPAPAAPVSKSQQRRIDAMKGGKTQRGKKK